MDEDIEKIIGDNQAKVLYVGFKEWSWLVNKSRFYKKTLGIETWKNIRIARVMGYNHLGIST